MTTMTTRFLILISLLFISFGITYSQSEEINDTAVIENTDTMMIQEETQMQETQIEEEIIESPPSFHQILKTKFIFTKSALASPMFFISPLRVLFPLKSTSSVISPSIIVFAKSFVVGLNIVFCSSFLISSI